MIGDDTVLRRVAKGFKSHLREIIIRIFLIIFFRISDDAVGFRRLIQPEEWWLYRYPRSPSIVPTSVMWMIAFTTPFVAFTISYVVNKSKTDVIQASLGLVFSVFLAGSIGNILKIVVGRPRPDFFDRCQPMEENTLHVMCTGHLAEVIQGYKSFPSGHAGLIFASMTFVSLYIAGKVHCFYVSGHRSPSWRLIIVIIPLIIATLVSISRTADNHHHWQDICVGGAIGAVIATLCYRQSYPSLADSHCHLPYEDLPECTWSKSPPVYQCNSSEITPYPLGKQYNKNNHSIVTI